MTDQEKLAIEIVGPGAVGIGIAYLLKSAGYRNISFYSRSGPIQKQASIMLSEGPVSMTLPSARMAPDLFIITVKSFQLEDALDRILKSKNKNPIWVLCNGLTLEIERNNKFNPLLIRRGSVTFGSKIVEGGGIHLTLSTQNLMVGPTHEHPTPLSDFEINLINQMKPYGWYYSEPINPVINKKWLFNTALNCLCGIRRLENNNKSLEYIDELKSIFEEAFALGIEQFGSWNEEKEQLWNELLELIKKTGSNENSMARDVRLKKKTEIEYLAGFARTSPVKYPILNNILTKFTN